MEKNLGSIQSLLKGKLTMNKVVAILFIWALAISTLYIETQLGIEGVTATMVELQGILDKLEVEINSTWYALQKPYSYIASIVSSGGTDYTCLQNGTTGQLEWYNTVPNVPIQSAIDVNDVSIFFRNGIYDLTLGDQLEVTDLNVIMVGEDWEKTVFLDSRDVDWSQTIYAVTGSTPIANLTVRNIKFDRSQSADTLNRKRMIRGSYNWLRVEHCKFIGNQWLANHGTEHHRSLAIASDTTDYMLNVVCTDNYIQDVQYGLWAAHSEYIYGTGNFLNNCQTIGLAASFPITDGQYIFTDNYCKNCAWFDIGIEVDGNGLQSEPINTNTLIANNLFWNDASHDLRKAINSRECNGVYVVNNKIVNYGTTVGNAIQIQGDPATALSNITVKGNDIFTLGYTGIYFNDVADGKIIDNIIRPLDQSSGVKGIHVALSDALTFNGRIVIEGNDIELTGSSNSRYAIHIARTAGTGSVIVQIRDNYLEAYRGVSTNYGSVFDVRVYTDNIFDCTNNIVNDGSGTAKWYGGESHAYLVYEQDSTYFMKNGMNGQVEGSSTDADSLIELAISSLTAGRDWYEKVYLKGDIDVDDEITIDSWLELTGSARITLEASSFTDVIFGRDEHHFIIDGLFIDANEDNNGNGDEADYNGIKLEGCYEFTIRNNRITSANRHGIVVERQSASHTGCNESLIINNYVEDCNYNGITLGYSHGITVSENHITWCSDAGTVSWQSSDCVWQGNNVWNIKKNSGGASDTGWGMGIELSGNRVIFDGNTIWNCEIGIAVSSDTSELHNNLVVNNMVYDSDTLALSMVGAIDCLVDGNVFDSNDAANLIWIGALSENCTLSNNIISNSAGDGAVVWGDWYTFMNNHWLHIGDDAIFLPAGGDGGDYCSIIGDEFRDVTDIAIEIGSGVSNTLVTSCVMRDIGDVNEISDAGTATADHDNYLDEDGWVT